MTSARPNAAPRRFRPGTPQQRGRPIILWWAGSLLVPFVAAFSPYTAMLVLVGLLPAIVAWITTPPAQRYCAACIGYLSMAGVVPVAWSLLQAGASASVAGDYLANPFVWLAMYSPAALGWLVYLTVPPVHEMLFMRGLQRRRRWLERRQKRLVEEWGPQADPMYGDEEPTSVQEETVS